jgi:hypothetical protein
VAIATAHGDDWRFDGDAFADSFNQRRAIVSTDGKQFGYLKYLRDETPEDPWLEQWANEEIFSRLSALLEIPCTECRAGAVEGVRGAVTVFMEGNKVSMLQTLGFAVDPVVAAAVNRNQFGTIVSLDVWTMNTDRGAHNAYVTMESGRPTLRLIDHGHTLLLPREEKGDDPDPERFATKEWTQRLLAGNFFRPFVADEEIVASAGNITSLGDDEVRSAVEAVDEQFFLADRDAMATLLLQRRDSLRTCLEEAL